MQKMVFEIVESPIPGDPLAALRLQNAPMTPAECRAHDQAYYNSIEDAVAMHDFNEDRSGSMPADLLRSLQQEIEAIMGGSLGNVTFRSYRVNERGELEEI